MLLPTGCHHTQSESVRVHTPQVHHTDHPANNITVTVTVAPIPYIWLRVTHATPSQRLTREACLAFQEHESTSTDRPELCGHLRALLSTHHIAKPSSLLAVGSLLLSKVCSFCWGWGSETVSIHVCKAAALKLLQFMRMCGQVS